MNITKMKNNLKNINSKKGISLVLAIALSIVLCMTTATFIAIALLQQNDTGSELNTRQAYISTKGSIETAENLLEEEVINAPSTGGKLYYVMYYDMSGNLQAKQFTLVDDAKNWIKSNKDTFEIIGNTYVTISNDGSGNCRITAAGTESKYSGSSGDTRERKLSKSFKIKKEAKLEKTSNETLTYTIDPPKDAVPGARGTNFLAVGMQTNFTLLYSYGNFNGGVWQLGRDYVEEGNAPIMVLSNEASADYDTTHGQKMLANSQLPLVFNYCVKGTTDQPRCTFYAGENGVYFLGNMSNTSSDYDGNLTNAAYFTGNAVYAPTFETAHMVINHNMYTRRNGSSLDYGINVKYSGSKSYSKVCVYLASSVKFGVYDDITKKERSESFTLSKGVYLVPSGYNLFNKSNFTKISGTDEYVKNEAKKYGLDLDYADNIISINPHAGFEERVDKTRNSSGISPVCILGRNSDCKTDHKVYGSITESSAYKGWEDYDIYCAPNWMPGEKDASLGEYHWYSGSQAKGGSFNFLWYNIRDMVIKEGVKLNMHSNSIVLSIGPDTGEQAGTKTYSGGSYKTIVSGSASGYSNVKERSNVLIGEKNSEFWLKPWWGETGFSINVKSEFVVKYDSNGDGTADKTYTVKEGEYKMDSSGSSAAYASSGINLFSSAAETFFKNAGSEAADSSSSTVGWVDSTGTIVNGTPSDQSTKVIKFKASAGSLAVGQTYKAKSILGDFSMSALDTAGATFQAKYVEIKATKLQGQGLYINTSSGWGTVYTVKKGSTEVKGNLVRFTNDTVLKLKNVDQPVTVEAGYYLFPDSSGGATDILNKNSWNSVYHLTTTGGDNPIVKLIEESKKEFSGGYY